MQSPRKRANESGRESESGRKREREWEWEREKLEMKGPKSTWFRHRSRQLLRGSVRRAVPYIEWGTVDGVEIRRGVGHIYT